MLAFFVELDGARDTVDDSEAAGHEIENEVGEAFVHEEVDAGRGDNEVGEGLDDLEDENAFFEVFLEFVGEFVVVGLDVAEAVKGPERKQDAGDGDDGGEGLGVVAVAVGGGDSHH